MTLTGYEIITINLYFWLVKFERVTYFILVVFENAPSFRKNILYFNLKRSDYKYTNIIILQTENSLDLVIK